MKPASTAFGRDVDLSDAFELGRISIILKLKLLHRIERRCDRRCAEGWVVIRLPIDLESYGRGPGTADRHRATAFYAERFRIAGINADTVDCRIKSQKRINVSIRRW